MPLVKPPEEFPPVELASPLQPFRHPQFIPPGPHNLPPPSQRPGARVFTGIAASDLAPSVAPMGPLTPTFDRSRFVLLAGEGLTLAIGTVAALLAVPSPSQLRSFLGLRNSGATNLFVAFGVQATVNSWLRLASNQMVLFDTVVPQDEVWVISDAPGGQLTAVTSNYSPDVTP